MLVGFGLLVAFALDDLDNCDIIMEEFGKEAREHLEVSLCTEKFYQGPVKGYKFTFILHSVLPVICFTFRFNYTIFYLYFQRMWMGNLKGER